MCKGLAYSQWVSVTAARAGPSGEVASTVAQRAVACRGGWKRGRVRGAGTENSGVAWGFVRGAEAGGAERSVTWTELPPLAAEQRAGSS